MSATVLIVDLNNNEVGQRFSMRKSLMLIGAVGLVAIVALIGVVSFVGQGFTDAADEEQVASATLRRSIRSNAATTLEDVRAMALELGSHPPDNLADLDKQNDICYTQGCLDAAVNLLNSINFTINPCDDFYQFSCGRWLSNNQIPPSSSRWSQFNFLRDEVNNVTQGILTAAKNNSDALPINQVKDLYAACVDTAKLEDIGLTPLRDVLKGFGDWPLLIPGSWQEADFDFIKSIGDVRRRLLTFVLISVYVDQDMKSTDNNIIYIDQPSLVLPRDMLINEGGNFNLQIEAYKQFVKDVANELEAGLDAEVLAASVNTFVEFEQSIAAITVADENRTETDRMYNKFTLNNYQAEIDPIYADLKVKELLDGVFSTSSITIATAEPIVVLETEYVKGLAELLKNTNTVVISNYLNFRVVSRLVGETTKAMRDHAFKFNKVLTGAAEPPTREKTCADGANNGLGMAIGVKYIEQKFDENAKTEVNRLVEDLRVAFKGILDSADWMDAATTALAQTKADTMKSFMAYPDWLSNKTEVEKYFDGLVIEEGTHFVNVESLYHWSGDEALKTLREPVDRNFWLTYPGVVNAFYAPTYNSITFPAGILQAPFFKSGYPSFLNYGGIGVVIGHEITHGFDHQGRQYDANGNAENWWSDATSDNYNVKAKCIEEQYSKYTVTVENVEMNVNGLLTLGENIADNGGVREAYIAYKKFVVENGVEKRLPGLEQFEPEQLFFMGYANIWCENLTPAGLRNQILTDPHSPARYRVKGPLSNNEDFSTKWNCPIGSGMNPNPADRCILW